MGQNLLSITVVLIRCNVTDFLRHLLWSFSSVKSIEVTGVSLGLHWHNWNLESVWLYGEHSGLRSCSSSQEAVMLNHCKRLQENSWSQWSKPTCILIGKENWNELNWKWNGEIGTLLLGELLTFNETSSLITGFHLLCTFLFTAIYTGIIYKSRVSPLK